MAGHRVSYRVWSLVFTLISLAIANIGLSAIIALSVPVLEFLYPIAIVLVALALFGRVFTQRFPRAYLWTVLGAGIASGANAIRGLAAVFGAHLEWLDRACAVAPCSRCHWDGSRLLQWVWSSASPSASPNAGAHADSAGAGVAQTSDWSRIRASRASTRSP